MVFGWGKKENVIKNDIVETELPSNSEITLTEIPAILHDIQNLREKTLIAEPCSDCTRTFYGSNGKTILTLHKIIHHTKEIKTHG